MYGLLGVVVLIAVIVFYARRRGGGTVGNIERPKPNCDWVKTGDAKGRLQEYKCTTCNVTGYSSTGNPPIECKRNLKTGS